MSNNNSGAAANGSEINKPVASGFDEVPMLRLPECLVMLSPDQENGEKVFEGNIGFKYGPDKKDWLRLPYMSMKKLIDFCMDNKELFNAQLKKEREKNQVTDL